MLGVFSIADEIEIDDFEVDLYSKKEDLKKIQLKALLIGDNLEGKKPYALDALNTVISGYFYEDLFTEAGKLGLKKTFIKYLEKRHGVMLEELLILSLSSKNCPKCQDIANSDRSSKGESGAQNDSSNWPNDSQNPPSSTPPSEEVQKLLDRMDTLLKTLED